MYKARFVSYQGIYRAAGNPLHFRVPMEYYAPIRRNSRTSIFGNYNPMPDELFDYVMFQRNDEEIRQFLDEQKKYERVML